MDKLKWLYPGLQVKRWILLVIVGLFLVSSGLAVVTGIHGGLLFEEVLARVTFYLSGGYSYAARIISGIFIILWGLLLSFWALSSIEKNLSRKVLSDEKLVDVLYKESHLKKGPCIVSLGGGTGLSNLLRGLKEYSSNITAVVTVADDGGSSGKLREEMGILPPGDIRSCLIALADREPLMQKLLQYRFSTEGDLAGHSFGNLFIASMNEVVGGSFEEAVSATSKVLAVRGQVLPATNKNIQLGAVYEDETILIGESKIPDRNKDIKKVFLKPHSCQPTAATLHAISEADIITIGPGSLYTSILPNLMVENIAAAVRKSRALKIYICNVMTQPGETDDFTVGDHIRVLYQHVGDNLFDYVLVNTQKGAPELRKRYQEEGAFPVQLEKNVEQKYNLNILQGALLSEDNFMRHDPQKTAARIIELLEEN